MNLITSLPKQFFPEIILIYELEFVSSLAHSDIHIPCQRHTDQPAASGTGGYWPPTALYAICAATAVSPEALRAATILLGRLYQLHRAALT